MKVEGSKSTSVLHNLHPTFPCRFEAKNLRGGLPLGYSIIDLKTRELSAYKYLKLGITGALEPCAALPSLTQFATVFHLPASL
jgi:hypothetical protein